MWALCLWKVLWTMQNLLLINTCTSQATWNTSIASWAHFSFFSQNIALNQITYIHTVRGRGSQCYPDHLPHWLTLQTRRCFYKVTVYHSILQLTLLLLKDQMQLSPAMLTMKLTLHCTSLLGLFNSLWTKQSLLLTNKTFAPFITRQMLCHQPPSGV